MSSLVTPYQTTRPLVYTSLRKEDANQTITTATWTQVTFSARDFDSGSGELVGDLTNDRIVCPFAGHYSVTAQVRWDNNATGIRELRIRRFNSSGTDQNDEARSTSPAMGSSPIHQNLSMDYVAAAGDRIELWAYQDTGGNLDLLRGVGGAAPWLCFLKAKLLSPTP